MIAAAYPCPMPRCDGVVMMTKTPGYPKPDVCPECGWVKKPTDAVGIADELIADPFA